MDDVFGSNISTATPRPKPQDPFGMGNFSIPVNGNADSNSDYHSLGFLDKKIMEMKVHHIFIFCNYTTLYRYYLRTFVSCKIWEEGVDYEADTR